MPVDAVCVIAIVIFLNTDVKFESMLVLKQTGFYRGQSGRQKVPHL